MHIYIFIRVCVYIYIYTYNIFNPTWNKPHRIEDLGVQFYSAQVGRPGLPIELYLYIPI